MEKELKNRSRRMVLALLIGAMLINAPYFACILLIILPIPLLYIVGVVVVWLISDASFSELTGLDARSVWVQSIITAALFPGLLMIIVWLPYLHKLGWISKLTELQHLIYGILF